MGFASGLYAALMNLIILATVHSLERRSLFEKLTEFHPI
jgi:hypothetical protein